jgi:hypothetical protein
MALGYSTIICRNTEKHFFEWMHFLKSVFTPINDRGKMNVINNEGDIILIEESDLFNFFCKEKGMGIKVNNQQGNIVNCFLRLSADAAYCYEEYTLDQLLIEEEVWIIFKRLNNRFIELVEKKTGTGIIFDPTGYTEDYISLV